jgi:hypothetical protein
MFDRPLSKRAGMVFEVTLSIRQQSLSWDEDDHLYAGYMSLTQRDFGMKSGPSAARTNAPGIGHLIA